MRLTDVHGALAAAYGRNAGQNSVNRKAEPAPGPDRERGDQDGVRPSAGPRVEDFAQGVEKFMLNLGVELKFRVSDSGDIQAEVRQPGGEKLIRKIPPDEVMELAESIRRMSGAFLDKTL
ncbi:MAG: flagellar protein FlaG [Thermodesulfobacteriota bacterium]